MAPQDNFQKTGFLSVLAPKKPGKWPNFQIQKIHSNVKFYEESDGDAYFALRSLGIRFSGHFLKIDLKNACLGSVEQNKHHHRIRRGILR